MADLRELLAIQRDRWSAMLCDTELAASKTCSEPNRRALLEAKATMARAYERDWFLIEGKLGSAAAQYSRQQIEGTAARAVAEPVAEQAGLFA